jgi:hypothetical protein
MSAAFIRILFPILLGLAVFTAAPQPAEAQSAQLADITVSNTRENLLLYFKLTNAFSAEIRQVVHKGVPTTFTFYIRLSQLKPLWFDDKVAEIVLTHTIIYDAAKRTYSVDRSWKEGDPLITPSFQQAQRWMTEIDGLKVYPLKELDRGRQYRIGMMGELKKLKLPLGLEVALFSLWDVKTDWYMVDFIF